MHHYGDDKMGKEYFTKSEKSYFNLTEEDKLLWDEIIKSVKDAIEEFNMNNCFDLKILYEPMKV